MKKTDVQQHRKRLQQWLKGLLAVALTGIFIFKKKSKKTSLRMLTQDGRLVEIDPKAILKKSRKIESGEIHHWVKK